MIISIYITYKRFSRKGPISCTILSHVPTIIWHFYKRPEHLIRFSYFLLYVGFFSKNILIFQRIKIPCYVFCTYLQLWPLNSSNTTCWIPPSQFSAVYQFGFGEVIAVRCVNVALNLLQSRFICLWFRSGKVYRIWVVIMENWKCQKWIQASNLKWLWLRSALSYKIRKKEPGLDKLGQKLVCNITWKLTDIFVCRSTSSIHETLIQIFIKFGRWFTVAISYLLVTCYWMVFIWRMFYSFIKK